MRPIDESHTQSMSHRQYSKKSKAKKMSERSTHILELHETSASFTCMRVGMRQNADAFLARTEAITI